MRLSRIAIKNFRAISCLTVEVGQHTVLLGANGVGKSCIIKAVDRFFSKSSAVAVEDFHNKNIADPIEISLTFTDFTVEEADQFASRIHYGSMVVSRYLVAGASSKDNGKYYGQTPRHAKFQEIRAITGAIPRREAYAQLHAMPEYADLATATNEAAVISGMDTWEVNHPDQCVLDRDDGQFFGFSNVGRGILQKYISFVFVPAIRDASTDSSDKNGSVISQLIDLIVKTVVQKRTDFKEWQERASAEYKELVSPANLGELSGLSTSLTHTLQQFYNDTSVGLAWHPPSDFEVSLPAANVALTEQGYEGPVDGKGHGLQRAFIFTILQHLANAIQSASIDPVVGEEEKTDAAPQETSHTLILAIEEPELYQHPTKQRHLARVLAAISSGRLAGVVGRTQILTCSHSPYFVSPERFAEVRLARRVTTEDSELSHCSVSQVSNKQVCDLLNAALEIPEPEQYKEDTLVSKMHILDPLVAEGFFATVAVLVEGAGDRAALTAVAVSKGISLEAEGIAVLPVNGKSNISRPLAVFSLLGIPCYAVYDSDLKLKPADQHPEYNLGIQRLSGEASPEPFRTVIRDRYASFENCLEDILEGELGANFEEEIAKAAAKYGLTRKRLLKSPVSLEEIVGGCAAHGSTSGTLSGIVDAIVSLRNEV